MDAVILAFVAVVAFPVVVVVVVVAVFAVVATVVVVIAVVVVAVVGLVVAVVDRLPEIAFVNCYSAFLGCVRSDHNSLVRYSGSEPLLYEEVMVL